MARADPVVLVFITVLFGFVMCVIASRANAKLMRERRLPMQWWFDGTVTWSAPRRLALAFVPVLGSVVLTALCVLANWARPRAGQEGMVLPSFIVIGMFFVGTQVLHIRLISRSLKHYDRDPTMSR
ncbi:hypothetical protein KZ813_00145 [Sphingomonas sp. RHCKR7]|uniref:hypothetical protein n=1 Tax=Sphingomonas folli TaxID=2862497 RepID=UPI001CA5A5C2|nr:hypothetical protein [Sphingomonas folli]MBW6525245.1 hypothetical protein [Sphingomonas folli]